MRSSTLRLEHKKCNCKILEIGFQENIIDFNQYALNTNITRYSRFLGTIHTITFRLFEAIVLPLAMFHGSFFGQHRLSWVAVLLDICTKFILFWFLRVSTQLLTNRWRHEILPLWTGDCLARIDAAMIIGLCLAIVLRTKEVAKLMCKKFGHNRSVTPDII